MISSLAYVHPDAKIDASVEVGAFAYIDNDVEISAGTVVYPHATILSGTRIGERCCIFPSAVVGAIPQDLKFKGEQSYVYIGNNTVIRECATVHRGTASKGKTIVGNQCLIMAYSHVAHDCLLGNHVILSNATQLAGEVTVDDWAILGGGSLVHQFTHIGAHSMTQGGTKVNKDVPPYVIAAREPICYCGINSVGLNRRGFTDQQIRHIQDAYRLLYMSGLNMSQAIKEIEEQLDSSEERDLIIRFVKSSSRGVVRGI